MIWIVTPYSLTYFHWRLRGEYCLHLQGIRASQVQTGVRSAAWYTASCPRRPRLGGITTSNSRTINGGENVQRGRRWLFQEEQRSEVLKAVIMEIFRDVSPCSLLDTRHRRLSSSNHVHNNVSKEFAACIFREEEHFGVTSTAANICEYEVLYPRRK
jgi:hypothetical protein